MRKRELVSRLKADRKELLRANPSIFHGHGDLQRAFERRLFLLHSIERLLPEIIEKLERGE